jgi:hypothetical protein
MPDWTLAELRWNWDDAYEITDRPRWQARRRDGKGGWITAPDADALAELIRENYATDPVPRDNR